MAWHNRHTVGTVNTMHNTPFKGNISVTHCKPLSKDIATNRRKDTSGAQLYRRAHLHVD